jgi:hypothetical protein
LSRSQPSGLFAFSAEKTESMSELIVYHGNTPIEVCPAKTECYLYRIGTGGVSGGPFLDLNDATRLNAIAEEIRDAYSAWVYSLNDNFVDSSLLLNDLSVFFLTDLSCKRSEFFETYDLICGLVLLQERLEYIELSVARLIGVDDAFACAFRSIFPDTQVTIERRPKERISLARRLGADTFFLLKTLGVILTDFLTSKCLKNRPVVERVFFSFFPQMFDSSGRDTKYGAFAKKPAEFAVTVLSDGMHQKVSLKQYVLLSKKAEASGMQVIDRHLTIADVCRALWWEGRLWIWYAGQRKISHSFRGMDVSAFVRRELRFSISRIVRLCMLQGAIQRFLKKCQPGEFYYYPIEYPFGRMLSWATATASPATTRIGFQMSIVSCRRLEQFMAPEEASTRAPFIRHAPIPDKILAEDAEAASVYQKAGYQGIALMDKAYRYEYLDHMVPRCQKGMHLIAPGLHDGAVMLEQLSAQIRRSSGATWLIKPHPRADNQYLQSWANIGNVRVSTQSIKELLSEVSEVFVTYSSVGLEARKLGLKVTVISIPGRINPSPLLDAVG